MTGNINKVGVVGLGYVGLPLAIAFSKKFSTVGFDINATRIGELESGIDRTMEGGFTCRPQPPASRWACSSPGCPQRQKMTEALVTCWRPSRAPWS